ncbi:MAG: hypothetical protein EXR71_20860 [Myxococcales bacterium]|nr:hypothetical protein [Myxococcales bacterium]
MMLFLLSCDPAPDGLGPEAVQAEDTAPEATWVPVPTGCEAPAVLPADPLVLAGEARTTQENVGYLIEMVDVERYGDLVLGVGQGGLLVYDVSDPDAPALVGDGRGPGQDRFHRVEALDERYVAATNREYGIAVYDLLDPSKPVQVWSEAHAGWEGLSAVDGLLYVTDSEGLVVFDVANPWSPERVGEATGLDASWELSQPVGDWIYAADNTLGLVPIDISDPTAPTLGVPVHLGGGVLHVRAHGSTLYASLGGAGVAVLDASNPATPVEIARVETGGAAVMSAVANGILFVVDHEAILAWDVADPAAPLPIGRQETEQFALAVDADDDVAWVGDWALMEGWRVDPSAAAGQLDVPGAGLVVGTTTISNRGGGTLRLLGGAGEGLTIEASALEITPGGSAQLRIAGTGTSLCLATDDPDGPLRTFVVTEAGAPPIGEPAPDFTLTDLDGVEHRLSEQLGNPVLLVYFATW